MDVTVQDSIYIKGLVSPLRSSSHIEESFSENICSLTMDYLAEEMEPTTGDPAYIVYVHCGVILIFFILSVYSTGRISRNDSCSNACMRIIPRNLMHTNKYSCFPYNKQTRLYWLCKHYKHKRGISLHTDPAMGSMGRLYTCICNKKNYHKNQNNQDTVVVYRL